MFTHVFFNYGNWNQLLNPHKTTCCSKPEYFARWIGFPIHRLRSRLFAFALVAASCLQQLCVCEALVHGDGDHELGNFWVPVLNHLYLMF